VPDLLSDLDLEADLEAEPWEYPGPLPPTSGLLVADRYARLTPVPSRRLGQSRVAIQPGEEGERCTEWPLNYLLLRHNVPAVDARALVVAIGSNASPAVMRNKLRQHGESPVLPMIRGTLEDVGIGHSAHVSAAGYLAAAPYAEPGNQLDVIAALLDMGQLRCLDETEPNYVRRSMARGLVLENGEQPSMYYVYASRWGVLGLGDGQPLRFGSQGELLRTLANEAPSLMKSVGRLARLDGDVSDPGVLLPLFGRDETLRIKVRELLAAEGWAKGVDVGSALPGEGTVTYGGTSSSWRGGRAVRSEALEVCGSSDSLDRDGEPSIVLHPETAGLRGLQSHAVVRADADPQRPGTVVRVVADSRIAPGVAAVDQVVRNALGVELREHIILSPAGVRRNRVADAIIARPHYVMCRVQTADLATVEQPVCLMAPLAMSILGVDSGDEVIVEGMPRSDGHVAAIRLKAHTLPEDVQSRRETLGGGQLDSRFPSARDSLGVYPDLPWLFLDSAARTGLGLDGKLAAVRVRASRRHQLSEEFRDLLLLLVIAFIGLASLIDSVAILAGVLLGISIVTLLLIRTRVRLRLRSVMEGDGG